MFRGIYSHAPLWQYQYSEAQRHSDGSTPAAPVGETHKKDRGDDNEHGVYPTEYTTILS